MRLDRLVILLLLGMAAISGLVYFVPKLTIRPAAQHASFLIPSTFGIKSGYSVMDAQSNVIGSVTRLRAERSGILVVVELSGNIPITARSKFIVHESANERTRITIEDAGGDRISAPMLVASEIRFGPPDEMLEPSPVFPPEPGSLPSGLDPDDRLGLAGWHLRARQPGFALMMITPFVQTLPPGPHRARALENHGLAALSLRMIDEASASFEEARAYFTESGETHRHSVTTFNLAMTLSRDGKNERALELIESLPKNDTAVPTLERNLLLAGIYENLGRTGEAVTILETTSSLSPIATLNYGILLRKAGLTRDSIRVLNFLEGSWAGEALVRYHLGRSYEADEQFRNAVDQYRQAAMLEHDENLAAIFRNAAEKLSASQ